MELNILFLFIYALGIQASIHFLRDLTVPEYAFVGGSAILTCTFGLRDTHLYSLKWYHNNTEFYRYVPSHKKGPISVRTNRKFILQEISRSPHQVMLNLSHLTPVASGDYLCEIIAEHPSFRTETLSASMKVVSKDEYLYPPKIVGTKDMYEPDDLIELECQQQLQASFSADPRPSIKWYLNGQMVESGKISNENQDVSVILKLPAEEVLDMGGTSEAECRLFLGNHQEKTSTVLRVWHRPLTIVNNSMSKGPHQCFSPHLGTIIFTLLIFLCKNLICWQC